jgi:plasmid stabilization system protein ParE
MNYHITFHPESLKEYLEASIWYEMQAEGLGARFEQSVDKRISQIANNPDAFSIVSDPYRQAGIESFPFVIVYTFRKHRQDVYISAIFHTKRNPRHKFRKP